MTSVEPAAAPAYVGYIVYGLALTSAATLFWLFQRHLSGRPLLVVEPRRPVPWNFVAPLAVLFPVLAAILASLNPGETPVDAKILPAYVTAQSARLAAMPSPLARAADIACTLSASEWLLQSPRDPTAAETWQSAILLISLAAMCYFLLVFIYGATRFDLGLPESARQLGRDAALGALAFIAVLLPLYVVQISLTLLMERVTIHPLMEQMTRDRSLSMAVGAAVAAILAAPIFEETAFRLIFQGWLERCECRPCNVAALRQLSENSPSPAESILNSDAPALASQPLAPCSLIPGLTPGWAPILLTAVLFGLAHVGQGAAAGSLMILGVALGYLYSRTHRIVPCIVCHMLFNALSLTLFMLQT